MPKTRRIVKKGAKSSPVHVAFKMGSRKVSRSAHSTPTEELVKEYNSSSVRARDKAKIVHILRLRGAALPGKESAEPTDEAK